MYTEVTRIRKPNPHAVHEGDPNPVHTEVAKMAVFGSDICADLSGSCETVRRPATTRRPHLRLYARRRAIHILFSRTMHAMDVKTRLWDRLPSDITDRGHLAEQWYL